MLNRTKEYQKEREHLKLGVLIFLSLVISTTFSCVAPSSYSNLNANLNTLKELKDDKAVPNISFVWDNPHNQNHPYYNVFKENERIAKEKGYEYIPMLYKFNQANQRESSFSKAKNLIVDEGGHNSLIFLLDHGSHKSLDTLQNFIHPGPGDVGYDAVYGITPSASIRNNAAAPIGKLPHGTTINIASPIGNKLKIRLGLEQAVSHANIKIQSIDGLVVKELVNKGLSAGSHTFYWKVNQPKGSYLLQVEMDGHLLSQIIGDHASIAWQ